MIVGIDLALVALLVGRTARIRSARARCLRERRFQRNAVAHHRRRVGPGECKLVAGLDDRARDVLVELGVGGLEFLDVRPLPFDRGAMIVEMLDGDLFRDIEKAAVVIAVIMRHPEMIELFDARRLQDVQDPIQVPLARVAGVHEQRLT